MSGTINPLYQATPVQGSIYGAQQPLTTAPQQLNPLMAGAMPAQQQVPLPAMQPGGPSDPMTQYMQWLMAPPGQQQQPAQGAMTPMGVPLPQYAPTPPGMAPTGPVATGNTADPYGLNAWALQQGIAAQGGWGGGYGAGGGSSGGSAGNMSGAAAAAQGADLMSGGIY
jgi:hypothetical protein